MSIQTKVEGDRISMSGEVGALEIAAAALTIALSEARNQEVLTLDEVTQILDRAGYFEEEIYRHDGKLNLRWDGEYMRTEGVKD